MHTNSFTTTTIFFYQTAHYHNNTLSTSIYQPLHLQPLCVYICGLCLYILSFYIVYILYVYASILLLVCCWWCDNKSDLVWYLSEVVRSAPLRFWFISIQISRSYQVCWKLQNQARLHGSDRSDLSRRHERKTDRPKPDRPEKHPQIWSAVPWYLALSLTQQEQEFSD